MTNDKLQFNAIVSVDFKDYQDEEIGSAPDLRVLRCSIPLTITRDAVTSDVIETMFLENAPPFTADILAGLMPAIGGLMAQIAGGRKPDNILVVDNEDFDSVKTPITLQ